MLNKERDLGKKKRKLRSKLDKIWKDLNSELLKKKLS